MVEVGEVLAVHSNFHDPERLTVGIWFAGRVTGGALRAGDDLAEVAFFPLADAAPAPGLSHRCRWCWRNSGRGKLALVPDSVL